MPPTGEPTPGAGPEQQTTPEVSQTRQSQEIKRVAVPLIQRKIDEINAERENAKTDEERDAVLDKDVAKRKLYIADHPEKLPPTSLAQGEGLKVNHDGESRRILNVEEGDENTYKCKLDGVEGTVNIPKALIKNAQLIAEEDAILSGFSGDEQKAVRLYIESLKNGEAAFADMSPDDVDALIQGAAHNAGLLTVEDMQKLIKAQYGEDDSLAPEKIAQKQKLLESLSGKNIAEEDTVMDIFDNLAEFNPDLLPDEAKDAIRQYFLMRASGDLYKNAEYSPRIIKAIQEGNIADVAKVAAEAMEDKSSSGKTEQQAEQSEYANPSLDQQVLEQRKQLEERFYRLRGMGENAKAERVQLQLERLKAVAGFTGEFSPLLKIDALRKAGYNVDLTQEPLKTQVEELGQRFRERFNLTENDVREIQEKGIGAFMERGKFSNLDEIIETVVGKKISDQESQEILALFHNKTLLEKAGGGKGLAALFLTIIIGETIQMSKKVSPLAA